MVLLLHVDLKTKHMEPEPQYITQQGYARMIGCDVVIIARAIKNGKIPKEAISTRENGWPQINLAIAEDAWGKHYRQSRRKTKNARQPADNDRMSGGKQAGLFRRTLAPVVEAPKTAEIPVKTDEADPFADEILPEITQKTTFAEAQRLGQIAETQMKQLKLEEARGSLVKVDVIEKVFFDFSRMIRNNFQGISDRIIDQVLSSPSRNEAHILLQGEIDQVLQSLSTLPEYRT